MKKKRLVVFKIWSQGRVRNERYLFNEGDDVEKLGKGLVAWFNATGGNSDGSHRRFEGVAYNQTFTKKDYENAPYVTDNGFKYDFDGYKPLNIDQQSLYALAEHPDLQGPAKEENHAAEK